MRSYCYFIHHDNTQLNKSIIVVCRGERGLMNLTFYHPGYHKLPNIDHGGYGRGRFDGPCSCIT